jgi:hypothetical protein
MTLKACSKESKDPLVVVEENKRKATFKNPERSLFRKITVDGCVIRKGIRADCAVEKDGVGTIIIEFKGRDIEHAADQITVTARYWKAVIKTKMPLAGLVLGSQYPKAPASFLKKQAAFAKEFKAPLRNVNKQGTFKLEDLLTFP